MLLFSRIRRRPWLLIGVIFVVVALGMLAGGVIGAWLESRYELEGRVTEGIVLAKDIRRATGDEGTQYRVSYRFAADGNRTIEASRAVSVTRWEELVERGPIQIQYLPSDPAQHRIYPATEWSAAAVGLLLAAVLGLIGGAATLHGWRRLRLERRLLRDGLMAQATVIGIEPSNVRLNGQYLWHVRYRYRDGQGRTHTGHSGYLSLEEAQGWHPGDIGGVRYDADDPERSLWTGSLLPGSASE
jgi:hypothetical protein